MDFGWIWKHLRTRHDLSGKKKRYLNDIWCCLMVFDLWWRHLIILYLIIFQRAWVWLTIISTSRFFQPTPGCSMSFHSTRLYQRSNDHCNRCCHWDKGFDPENLRILRSKSPKDICFMYPYTCSTVWCMYIYSMFVYIYTYICNHPEILWISNWIVSNGKMIKDFRYGW